MEKHLTTIPFKGFYESSHDSAIDYAIISYFDYEGNGNFPVIDGVDFQDIYDSFPYRKAYEAYALEYMERFSTLCDLASLTFDSLDSPREYNFATDRIFCHISTGDLMKVWEAIDKKALDSLIKDKFTSCSGFISGYDNALMAWDSDPTTWDHNQIGTLLECYAYQLIGKKYPNIDWEVMDELHEAVQGIVGDLMPPEWVAVANAYYESYSKEQAA